MNAGPLSPAERPHTNATTPLLRRAIGPVQMAFYGLGSMLGSGIYGLIGHAAGQVGNAVWLAFVVALVAALLTALSYASLGSRYPRAGGAAYMVQRAYRMPLLSFLVGLSVVASSLTSVATQSRVFAANLAELLGLDGVAGTALAIGFVLIMAGLVFRGIRESMWVNVLCTIIEATGLVVVIAVGLPFWGTVDLLATPAAADDGSFWLIVLNGAVLTFFAFIGFEDTVNVAEECRNPQRTVPIGLVAAMLMGAALYVLVAVTVVSVVPWQDLAAAASPLTEVVARAAPVVPSLVFTGITVFAVANTALVNYVTASRLVYGMAQQGLLPGGLGRVHPRARTPHVAVMLLLLLLLPLVAFGSIGQLASATVLMLLTVFAIVNAALVVLKRRTGEPRGLFEVPIFVPALGTVVCLGLVALRVSGGDWRASALAGGMLAAIACLYAVLRPTGSGHSAAAEP